MDYLKGALIFCGIGLGFAALYEVALWIMEHFFREETQEDLLPKKKSFFKNQWGKLRKVFEDIWHQKVGHLSIKP